MASTKAINEAFLTTAVKNDIEIEKATKRNIARITDKNEEEIHKNLMKVFNIKSIDDSKYFEFDNFSELVMSKKEEVEEKEKSEPTTTPTTTNNNRVSF
jgi:hypothetical protein